MNEYEIEISVIIGASFFAIGVFAYLSCWVGQLIWAWIDESDCVGENLLAEKLNLSKWKYPVHNGRYPNVKTVYGYTKDERLKNACVWDLKYGKDYIYTHDIRIGGYWSILSISLATPTVALIAFKVYPITLAILSSIAIMHVARISRRTFKKLRKHVSDKGMHASS